jgi:hypothetical protein
MMMTYFILLTRRVTTNQLVQDLPIGYSVMKVYDMNFSINNYHGLLEVNVVSFRSG